MKKYEINTHQAVNHFDAYLEIGDNISITEIASLQMVAMMYFQEIINDKFNISTLPEQVQYLSDFAASLSNIEEVDRKLDLKSDYWLKFSFRFVDIENDEKLNNTLEIIKSLLDLPKLTSNFEKTIDSIDFAIKMAAFKTPQQEVTEKIFKSRYFNNVDDYMFNNYPSKLADIVKQENARDIIIENVNSCIKKLKQGVKNITIYRNGKADILDNVEQIVVNNFPENSELTSLSQVLSLGEVEEKYIVNKTTANSFRFFRFDNSLNPVTNTITIAYYRNLIRKFYLDEIRLKHNLIYSPSIWISGFVGQAAHQVKQESIEQMLGLEDEFYTQLVSEKEVKVDEFENIIKNWRNTALSLYEENSWFILLGKLEELGIEVDSNDCEEIYDKYIEAIESIKMDDIDLSLFKYDGFTKIVGE